VRRSPFSSFPRPRRGGTEPPVSLFVWLLFPDLLNLSTLTGGFFAFFRPWPAVVLGSFRSSSSRDFRNPLLLGFFPFFVYRSPGSLITAARTSWFPPFFFFYLTRIWAFVPGKLTLRSVEPRPLASSFSHIPFGAGTPTQVTRFLAFPSSRVLLRVPRSVFGRAAFP